MNHITHPKITIIVVIITQRTFERMIKTITTPVEIAGGRIVSAFYHRAVPLEIMVLNTAKCVLRLLLQ